VSSYIKLAFAQAGVSGGTTAPTAEQSNNVSNIYDWTAVPQGQNIPITNAIIDEGGYQLSESNGDTIVVPFADQNLYAMKFAVSSTGSTYFVKSDSAPTLYLPKDGYIDNVTVAGTRWYPFTDAFQPSDPVYEGIAPSWSEFILMGWYSGMNFYGGYSGQTSFTDGGKFAPVSDLYVSIGGHQYQGWGPYRDYCDNNRTFDYVTFNSRGIYQRAENQGPPNSVEIAIPLSAPVTQPIAAPVATVPENLQTAPSPAPINQHIFRGAIGGYYDPSASHGSPPVYASPYNYNYGRN